MPKGEVERAVREAIREGLEEMALRSLERRAGPRAPSLSEVASLLSSPWSSCRGLGEPEEGGAQGPA